MDPCAYVNKLHFLHQQKGGATYSGVGGGVFGGMGGGIYSGDGGAKRLLNTGMETFGNPVFNEIVKASQVGNGIDFNKEIGAIGDFIKRDMNHWF